MDIGIFLAVNYRKFPKTANQHTGNPTPSLKFPEERRIQALKLPTNLPGAPNPEPDEQLRTVFRRNSRILHEEQ